jgi:NTE family protein
MTRINQLIDSVPVDRREGAMSRVRPLDTMIVVPSKDLRELAHEHVSEMPRTVRALLRGVGGRSDGGANRLISFLLFEQGYTQALMRLGYDDAMAVKDQLLAFVSGEDVPRLFAPSWVRRDLTGTAV